MTKLWLLGVLVFGFVSAEAPRVFLSYFSALQSGVPAPPTNLVVVSSASDVTNAASCSQANVQAAINLASNGDTVVIPAGTCTWTTRMDITKAITLRGSGIGQTIIQDGVTSGPLLTWTAVANEVSRMTGIEFRNNGRSSQEYNGIIVLTAANTDGRTIRVDHNKFDHLNGVALQPVNLVGLIDHNTFLTTPTRIPIYVYDKGWNGGVYGDKAWTAPTQFGTGQFLFIEDNTITADEGTFYACVDSYGGSRWVARYNTFTRCFLSAHGTESAQRNRGTRAVEIYNNTFVGNQLGQRIHDHRSGSLLIYNNTVTGFINPPSINLTNDRSFYPFPPWGAADGANLWDVNFGGDPAYTGKASGGTGFTVRVDGAQWTTNQWAGYSIRKTSTCSTTVCASIIVSNTGDTITWENKQGFPGTDLAFTNGETFVIRKVVHGLDQPGRSGGGLVTGDTPSAPAGFNDQVTDPIYSWNNKYTDGGGGSVSLSSFTSTIRSGEHYFNNTPKPGYTPYTYPHPLAGAQ